MRAANEPQSFATSVEPDQGARGLSIANFSQMIAFAVDEGIYQIDPGLGSNVPLMVRRAQVLCYLLRYVGEQMR
jgi:hypothetical protein